MRFRGYSPSIELVEIKCEKERRNNQTKFFLNLSAIKTIKKYLDEMMNHCLLKQLLLLLDE